MNIIAKELWIKIQKQLEVFAERVIEIDPTPISNVGNTTNDVFFLRGYLSLMRDSLMV